MVHQSPAVVQLRLVSWSQCTSEILPFGEALSKPNPMVCIYVCHACNPSTLILWLFFFFFTSAVDKAETVITASLPPQSHLKTHHGHIQEVLVSSSLKKKRETTRPDVWSSVEDSPYPANSQPFPRTEKKRSEETQQAQGWAHVNPQMTLQTPQIGHSLNKLFF